jgi:hypothetical protein
LEAAHIPWLVAPSSTLKPVMVCVESFSHPFWQGLFGFLLLGFLLLWVFLIQGLTMSAGFQTYNPTSAF